MSNRLVDTLENPEPYLHSPVDDIESFYYTAQWAAAFNDGASGGRHDGVRIQKFREMIADDRRERASNMLIALHPVTSEAGYGTFFARSLPLLAAWRVKSFTLGPAWSGVMHDATLRDGEDKEEFLRLNCLIYGYRGVAEYLQLVHEYRASLQGEV